MAWTDPKTWSVGEVLTSSDMNTYVRDNTTDLDQRSRIATAVQALKTSGQVFASSSTATVQWQSSNADYSGRGVLTVDTTNNEIDVTEEGIYLMDASLRLNAGASGRSLIFFRKNATEFSRNEINNPGVHHSAQATVRAVNLDRLDVQYFHNTGSDRTITAADTYLNVIRL